ncbi:MAG: hypothetical protein V3V41_08775 [Candidatus Heimdallarchaeota archaeon]
MNSEEFNKNEDYRQFDSISITQNSKAVRNFMVTNSTSTKDVYVTMMNKVENKDKKNSLMGKSKDESCIKKELKVIQVGETVISVLISNSMKYLFLGLGDVNDIFLDPMQK